MEDQEVKQEPEYVFSPWPVLLTAGDLETMRRWALHRCTRCGNTVLIPVVSIPAGAILQGVGKDKMEDAMRKCGVPPVVVAYMVLGDREVCPRCGSVIEAYPQRVITPSEKRKLDLKAKKQSEAEEKEKKE